MLPGALTRVNPEWGPWGRRVGTMSAMNVSDTKNFTMNLTRWAVAGSIAYLILLVCLGWGRWEKLLTMELNEVGDFLAGAFSPLAFLWLVVGYFQQGHELSASVAQLERHATISDAQRREEQERFIAATTPKLTYSAAAFDEDSGQTPIGWYFKATNIGGATCSELRLRLREDRLELDVPVFAKIGVQSDATTSIYWARNVTPVPIGFQLEVSYLQGALGLRTDIVDLEFYARDEGLHLRVRPVPTNETRPS
jgi:hypothetical protein